MSELNIEKTVIVLTDEQQRLSSVLETLISEAIQPCCADCDTARFAPKKIGGVVVPRMIGSVKVERSLSWEGAVSIADRFRACPGSPDGMCHYPPPQVDTEPLI